MKAREVMTEDVLNVEESSSIGEAMRIICQEQVAGVPVVDEKKRLVGIISEKDILKAMYPSYAEFCEDPVSNIDFEQMESRSLEVSEMKIKELMTRHVVTATSEAPILKLGSTMILKRIRRIPIVDKGKLVGIVSQGDIHRAVFKKMLDKA